MKKVILAINLILFLIIGILVLDVIGWIGSTEQVQIEIQENDNLTILSEKLRDEHVVLSKHLFKMFYRISTHGDTIHPGTITVSKNDSYREITRAITMPSTDTVQITIPEGFEVREIVARLYANDLISGEEEFYNALKNYQFQTAQGDTVSGSTADLSGFLFPDTYEISHSATPEEIIHLMTSNFVSKWTDAHQKQADNLNMSMEDVITLASIIEREARKEEDFLLVSAVFHNRLKQGKKLESCATVQYILKERKPILSISDTKIKSPYNTYQNPGLPPAPIASPGMLAIESALNPAKTDNLFFFTDKNGDNHYSKTLEEHNRQIDEFGL